MTRAVPLRDLDRFLLHADRAICVLDRCRPENHRSEILRLIDAFGAGREARPEWRYAAGPDLGPVRRALSALAEALDDRGPWTKLYRDRALELLLEAELASAVGTPHFARLAASRFPRDLSPAGHRADERAREWIEIEPASARERIGAADEQHPESLVSRTRRLVGELRIPVRVTVRDDLACAAATGDGFVAVSSALSHTAGDGLRIAIHEVLGHALPRERARRERLGLFACGTAHGSEGEEGRALVLEERHGLLGPARQRDLALRHLAAVATRSGADFVELVRLARSLDVSIEVAVSVAARVLRGGGLAREIIYLPARESVRDALAVDPELETFLERGRVGVEAARVLRSESTPPDPAIELPHPSSLRDQPPPSLR